MRKRIAAAALCAALAAMTVMAPSPEAGAVEYRKNPVEDPVLDRNGDGFQDVIVNKRKVHYDIDFDGHFDYTLTLKFNEYTTKGHQRYLAGECDKEVFAELTLEGLDELCQDERQKAQWTADNFSTYYYYHDGYGFLSIFTDSPANDGRLADRKHKGEYDYRVTFNPDGSVRTARRGEERVAGTEFDHETNTNPGKKVMLPKIETVEDLQRIRSEIDHLFAGQ
jgi:hypothetical protein